MLRGKRDGAGVGFDSLVVFAVTEQEGDEPSVEQLHDKDAADRQ